MKKTKFMLIGALLLLTSCNKTVVDLNYNFSKVHIISEHKCYIISSWRDYDNSDQIQVKIKDYGVHLFHSNQIILVKDKCALCEV